LMQINL